MDFKLNNTLDLLVSDEINTTNVPADFAVAVFSENGWWGEEFLTNGENNLWVGLKPGIALSQKIRAELTARIANAAERQINIDWQSEKLTIRN